MYRMTPRMLQRFHRDLENFHALFSGGRCSAWQQEELIVSAINSDTTVNHHVIWREAGHDDKADIRVTENGITYPVQIKSGEVKRNLLTLSGYRMGRFGGDFEGITDYLKSKDADILAVPYEQINDEKGRKHIYQVSYVDSGLLRDVSESNWKRSGKSYVQTNSKGVQFKITPSMSWQVWWGIPTKLIVQENPFVIG